MLRLFTGMHYSAHAESCTASEKQHSFEVKKTTQNIPGMKLNKETKPITVKKRLKKIKKKKKKEALV